MLQKVDFSKQFYLKRYCFGNMCNGCNSCEGKVFHAPEGKACPIYDCVRNNKCMNDCGECAEIPCKIWHDTRDPKFSDEEFNENIAARMQTLKRRSDANVEK